MNQQCSIHLNYLCLCPNMIILNVLMYHSVIYICQLEILAAKFSTITVMMEDTAMDTVESTTSEPTYPHLILPGELLSTITSQRLKLGPGLQHTQHSNKLYIHATQAGLLHHPNPTHFLVDYNSHRVPPPFLRKNGF